MSGDKRPTHVDLFAGIGGFSIAAQWAGFRTIAHAEVDADASSILRHHWPAIPNLGDVTKIHGNTLESVDLVTAGVPCQPTSYAGGRRGSSDDRWLWPDTLRIVSELQPRFCLFENPPAILTLEAGRAFNRIVSELHSLGYAVWWEVVPAAAVGAGHLRERLFIVASHPSSVRRKGSGQCRKPCSPKEDAFREASELRDAFQRRSLPFLCARHDGFPKKMVKSALRCVGNAVVPQVAYCFLKAIRDQLP